MSKASVRLKSYARVFLTVVFLLLFLAYFKNNKESFDVLSSVDLGLLSLVFLGQILVLLANAGILIIIASAAGNRLGLFESAQVTVRSSLINFFGFFQAGLGYRGVFLKRRFGISYKFYSALTFAQYIMIFGFALCMGLLAYLFIKESSFLVAIFYFAIFLSVLFVYLLRRPLKTRVLNSRFGKITLQKFNKSTLILLFACVIVHFFGLTLSFGAELNAVGAEYSTPALVLYTCIAAFSLLFAITPGAIGIRETMLLIVSSQMMISPEGIILSATIDRIVYFILLLALAPIALINNGSKKMSRVNTYE